MADLIVTEKINQAGRSLTTSRAQALQAIATLKGIKTNLISLKALVSGDADFDQAAEDSVQAVIDELLAEIATI